MLTDSPCDNVFSRRAYGNTTALSISRSAPLPAVTNDGRISAERSAASTSALVEISPHRAVARRGMEWRGIGAEVVQTTSHDCVEYRFQAPVHLLIVYEQGLRRDGETFIEGLPRSTLRDVTRKLAFVPAGHGYRETHDPRTLANLMYFYVDPAELRARTEMTGKHGAIAPRLFFEDASLWDTALKLKRALEGPGTESRLYIEALALVLAHDLSQFAGTAERKKALVRGGLAAWQQRLVTSYIDEHLSEQISLATLAEIVRLSPYYFCRAFKQSIGTPPHRYHMTRRIDRAKLLLAERKHSVTEVGLTLGFSDTSSFTAAFRRMTGMTPSGYSRGLA